MASKYNRIVEECNGVLKEKETLDELLRYQHIHRLSSIYFCRNETLNNEQQRAYIEILKQMLEDKLDKLGLSRFGAKY